MAKFNSGDRVRLARPSKYVNLQLGAVGTVDHDYNGNVVVQLDCYTNSRSSRGLFYFTEYQLEKVTKENEGDLTIMEGNYRIANVSFLEGSNTTYTYRYACYDESIEVNDICVVKSAHHGMGIAIIKSFEDKTDESIQREIICKADFSAYYKREADRVRKAELKKLMDKRVAELQERSLYEMLAKGDAAMAEMLKEYKEISDGC